MHVICAAQGGVAHARSGEASAGPHAREVSMQKRSVSMRSHSDAYAADL